MRAFFKTAVALALVAGAFAAPVAQSDDDSTTSATTADDTSSSDDSATSTTDDSSSTSDSSAAAASSGYSNPFANCVAVTFNVSGTAQNRNLTGVPTDTLANLTNFYNSAPFITVSGSQIIAGTYCKPTNKYTNSNSTKLEVLFNSITADRSSWDAQGGVGSDFPEYEPELYSWVRFANALGYPTLAIDRLGNGKSSHPDPVLVVQAAYEIALYNDLSRQLRAGAAQLGGQKYSNLIYVGNSYGSQLGAGIAGTYPNAYNTFVLTGYTNSPQKGFVGISMVDLVPAQTLPMINSRQPNLPAGYLSSSSETGRTNSFFGSKQQVDFSDTVAHLFYEREDVVSVGQVVSVYAYPFNGAGFTGRVINLTGEQDQAFCGPGSPVIGPAECGSQLKDTGVVFPNADYNWQAVNRTGHAIQLHYSSLKVYTIAHLFLAGVEFKNNPPI